MKAWRKYKKWKGQKVALALCQLMDYLDAMYDKTTTPTGKGTTSPIDPVEDDQKEGEKMDAVRMRCNHKGWPIGPLALRKILEELERWQKSKKKFRVIIDYDPEWSMIVNIRPSTYDESVMLDVARPDEAIMKNLKRCEEQRRQEDKP